MAVGASLVETTSRIDFWLIVFNRSTALGRIRLSQVRPGETNDSTAATSLIRVRKKTWAHERRLGKAALAAYVQNFFCTNPGNLRLIAATSSSALVAALLADSKSFK